MVQYQPTLDHAFGALSDPTRRAVLERLGSGAATITELAEPFAITLTGMRKHVRVLEEAGLVASEKVGRVRQCRLTPSRLDEIEAWLGSYRQMLETRMDRFGEMLERRKGELE